MPEQRLDSALVSRGIAPSRTQAARWIAEGLVTVDGRAVVKASTPVAEAAQLDVAGADHYVSRAAHKLIAALDAWPEVIVEGRHALVVGASTGGFTQVLLERGAAAVVALDVGHGQLDPRIRADARVLVVEGENARALDAERYAQLVADGGAAPGIRPLLAARPRPELVVGDLSFIPLGLVLPALVAVAEPGADLVLLIKPQFEVGRTGIREGIVHDAALRADAITGVLWAAWDLGLGTAGLVPSPIAGGSGNHEYLVWLSARVGGNPTEWIQRANEMAGA